MKKKEEGAPAYFALFTSLMTVMLAFFILLTALADKQESGFENGIGDIRNAFGLQGGFGLFTYAHLVRGHSKHPVPSELTSKSGDDGLHLDMVLGKGGGGNTDALYQETGNGRYLRIEVPQPFEEGSYVIPLAQGKFLQLSGTALALMDYKLSIKCYSGEHQDEEMDRILAARRAASIMRFLHENCRLPLDRMEALGYASTMYVDPAMEMQQVTCIDIYQKPRAKGEIPHGR